MMVKKRAIMVHFHHTESVVRVVCNPGHLAEHQAQCMVPSEQGNTQFVQETAPVVVYPEGYSSPLQSGT